jgi:hypothetical protein
MTIHDDAAGVGHRLPDTTAAEERLERRRREIGIPGLEARLTPLCQQIAALHHESLPLLVAQVAREIRARVPNAIRAHFTTLEWDNGYFFIDDPQLQLATRPGTWQDWDDIAAAERACAIDLDSSLIGTLSDTFGPLGEDDFLGINLEEETYRTSESEPYHH